MDSANTSKNGRRIVLTTFGSLGDLHPYLAVAQGLRERGHTPVIATLEMYREKVEGLGLEYCQVKTADVETPDRELMRKATDARRGLEFIIRELLMPCIRRAYEDGAKAAEGADALVAHPLMFTTRIVAEERKIPWASTILAPMGFLSAHDPPALPLPLFSLLRRMGPRFHRTLLKLIRKRVHDWCEPVDELRKERGLPAVGHPLFEGLISPSLNLAMFSRILGQEQPDWPAKVLITGFPFFDEGTLSPEISAFLDAGDPPIVFTLGSSAVMDAGRFYHEAVEATKRLKRRALLLVGSDPDNRPHDLPETVFAADYAPYHAVFPRAAAIVHPGGVGTTAQAMRAGRPMLIMPYANDQPDNAARVARLGIGRTISRKKFTANRAFGELRRLLEDPAYRQKAERIGEQVRAEDGVKAASEALIGLASSVKSTP